MEMTRQQFTTTLKEMGVKFSNTQDAYGRTKIVLKKLGTENWAVFMHNDKAVVQIGKRVISNLFFTQEDAEWIKENQD